MKPKNTIGSWVSVGPDGDFNAIKTPKRSTMEPKVMVIFAVTQRGLHYFEILERGATMDSARYIEFLRNLEIKLRSAHPPILFENARIIMDNARPHISRETSNFLADKNVRLLKQPTYSPECNLCDRFVFPFLESKREGNFQNVDEVRSFLELNCPLLTEERMNKALTTMEDDLTRIINSNGDYL